MNASHLHHALIATASLIALPCGLRVPTSGANDNDKREMQPRGRRDPSAERQPLPLIPSGRERRPLMMPSSIRSSHPTTGGLSSTPTTLVSRVVESSRGANHVVDESFVHDEIKVLAQGAKSVIQQKLQRHATTRDQVVAGVLQFGPSAQSRLMLNREHEAAVVSAETGTYAVWRNESCKDPAHADFCSRVGPNHKCFCTHTLQEHQRPMKKGRFVQPPSCTACGCRGFQYVPNEPEEVGDTWLSRRKGFVAGSWYPKCRCTHGSNDHDPVSMKCKACTRCFRFDAHYACAVCDGMGSDHMTMFETEAERLAAGRVVGPAYAPFFDDQEIRDALRISDPASLR